jgi:DedD protein
LNQGTKQRIVGTVVLLALALIFLPIIFDGQGSYQTQLSSRIPDEPVISILPEPTQVRPVIIADTQASANTEPEEVEVNNIADDASSDAGDDGTSDSSEEQVQVSTSEPAFTREIPQLDESGLPQGWSVRMGSFAEEDNALNLMERLRSSGYKAYTRNVQNGQSSLTSVFVGPWLDRGLVDQYQEELQDEFRLAGDIVRFEIEQL